MKGKTIKGQAILYQRIDHLNSVLYHTITVKERLDMLTHKLYANSTYKSSGKKKLHPKIIATQI